MSGQVSGAGFQVSGAPPLLCILALTLSSTDYAQKSTPLDKRVSAALARMASLDIATRHAGLDDLVEIISEGQNLDVDPEYPRILREQFGARNS